MGEDSNGPAAPARKVYRSSFLYPSSAGASLLVVMSGFAFATLVTSDAYAKGAQVIAAALRELHPPPPTPPEVEFETVCIVTPETVDVSILKALRRAFDVVIGVEVIDEDQIQGLALLGASSVC